MYVNSNKVNVDFWCHTFPANPPIIRPTTSTRGRRLTMNVNTGCHKLLAQTTRNCQGFGEDSQLFANVPAINLLCQMCATFLTLYTTFDILHLHTCVYFSGEANRDTVSLLCVRLSCLFICLPIPSCLS